MIRVPGVIKGLAPAPLLLLMKTAHCTLMWCSNKCIYLEHISLPWLLHLKKHQSARFAAGGE